MKLTRLSVPLAVTGLLLCSACAPVGSVPVEMGSPADVVYVSRHDSRESLALYYFAQARLLMADDDLAGAAESLERAVHNDPDNEDLRFALAEVYIELERPVRARRTIEDILISQPESVRAHLMLGNAYFSNDQPERAIEHYRQVLKLEPDREQVQLHLAIALVRSGELDQAVDELKRLIRQNPESIPGRLALARLYREMKLGVLAEEQYRYLIEHQPESKQAYVELGLLFEEREEWASSLAIFRKAIQHHPLDFALRHHVARILVAMNRYDEALEALTLIIELSPDDFDARRKVGLIYLEQERWDDAIAVFKDILSLRPNLDIVSYYLGSALERKQDWPAALEAFGTIGESSPLYDDAISHLSYIYLETGRLDEAAALLENRLTKEDPRPQVFYYLTALYFSDQKLERALAVSEQGVARYPENADLLYQRALALEKTGRHAEAMLAVRDVLAVDDAHADALNFLAYAYAEANTNLDEALRLAQKALASSSQGHIYDTLGWVHYRLGNYPQALKAIEEAIRQLPDDEVILEHLAEVSLKLNDQERARRIYQRIIELYPENALAQSQLRALQVAP